VLVVGASVAAVAQSRNRTRSAPSKPIERSVPGVQVHPEAPGPASSLEADRRRNRRWPVRAALVGAVIVGVLAGLIALPISLPVSGILAVLVGIIIFFLLRRVAPRGVARSIGAGPVEPGQLPRVETLLAGLSVTMGVATPSISVLLDEVPNAAIIGTRAEPLLVLTSGLVASLSVVELEGVLAQLLANQRLDAVERGTAGAGIALLLSGIGRRRAHRLIGRGRLFVADDLAVLATRYPPALAAALRAMEQGPLPVQGSFFASSVYDSLRWLFVDPSVGRRAASDELGDIDATAVRRRALEER
jgi:Zn-dependent protease with chaperone function